MSHGFPGSLKYWGKQFGNVNRYKSDQRRGMVGRLGRRKLVIVRGSLLTALIGFRCGSALTLQAALHRLPLRGAAVEAIKGPEQQNHGHQSDRDVKAPSHSGFRIARGAPKPRTHLDL